MSTLDVLEQCQHVTDIKLWMAKIDACEGEPVWFGVKRLNESAKFSY